MLGGKVVEGQQSFAILDCDLPAVQIIYSRTTSEWLNGLAHGLSTSVPNWI
jgi:hypothetical protein